METSLTKIVTGEKVRNIKSIDADIRNFISTAIFLTGYDIHKDDLFAMSKILEKDIRKSKLANLTLSEISYAIEQGVKGEYGEYYGINNVSLLNFLKQYAQSERRAKAIRFNTQKRLPEKNEISQKDKMEFLKNAAIRKFEELKNNGTLNDYGNPTYNFLAKLGVINFSEEKREEFKKKAKRLIIAEETLKSTTSVANQRTNALKMIEDIKNDSQHKQVIAEAKRLALKDYFISLQKNNISLSDILK